jgi:hypothetical protein
MPTTGLIRNPNAAYGLPLTAATEGMNETVCIEVVNNSGTWLHHGDVVCWDNSTALSTVTPVLVSANFTLTQASQTITANASTASYAASGSLLIPVTVTGTAGTNTVPVFVSYTGIAGSTFTGASAAVASVTNGAQANASIFQWPTASYSGTAGAGNTNTVQAIDMNNYKQSVVSLAAQPADGGRNVTLSQTGAVNNPLVAGVVDIDATALAQAGQTPGVTPGGSFPNATIANGQPFMMAISGVAQVQISANTVASSALVGQSAVPGVASASTPTLGNLVGVALEAQTAKSSLNTIRVALKIG